MWALVLRGAPAADYLPLIASRIAKPATFCAFQGKE
jgi:hypothetical protein